MADKQRPDKKTKHDPERFVWTVDQIEIEGRDKKTNYSDDQPRDERGRFGEGGGGESSGEGKSFKVVEKYVMPADASAAPNGMKAHWDSDPEKGGEMFHGTQASDDTLYLDGDQDGVVYLTDDYQEALGYAAGVHLGGGEGGGTPRVLRIGMTGGKMVDISAAIDEEVGETGDFGKIFDKARSEGADFAFYTHPSNVEGKDEQRVIVALKPSASLGPGSDGWDARTGQRWRRKR